MSSKNNHSVSPPANLPTVQDERSPAGSNRSVAIPGLLFAAIAAVVGLSGCPSSEDTAAPAPGANAPTAKQLAERCEGYLKNAYSRLQPDRLGISTYEKTTAATLNQWYDNCGSEIVLSESGQPDPEQIRAALSDDIATRVLGTRFSARDARYIRSCLLHQTIANNLLSRGTTDLERVVQTFYHVVQNVALLPQDTAIIARTPFEILLFGRGFAEDRAWVFAEVLRQMDIDAVGISVPNQEDGAANEFRLLVGVMLDGSVYLFDPLCGLAVAAADDDTESVLPETPLTLKQLLAGPEASEPHGFSLNADAAQGTRIEVIGSSETWSHRMAVLQSQLAGDQAVVLHQSVVSTDNDERSLSGIRKLVAELKWPETAAGVWTYPDQQLTRFDHLDESQQRELDQLSNPFQAPRLLDDVKTIETQTIQFANPTRRQLKTRIDHLLGNVQAEVTQRYQSIRLSEVPDQILIPSKNGNKLFQSVPDDIYQMHALASEDASFWMAVCQLARYEEEMAIDTLRTYLRKYEDGSWTTHAGYLLGVALARSGQWAAAIRALDKAGDDATQARGNAILKQRWQAHAAQAESSE